MHVVRLILSRCVIDLRQGYGASFCGILARSDPHTMTGKHTGTLRMTINRRDFIEGAALVAGSTAVSGALALPVDPAAPATMRVPVTLLVNGKPRTILLEPRTTLLDALREKLHLTGTKKGCDRGECGACTVHVNGRRVLSCMSLAAMQVGKRITTIEGLEREGELHPLQAAFIEYDGFQCGFCTSGQIMSGVAMLEEARAGWPSAATADVTKAFAIGDLSPQEIRERMSGNLCRCACYPNIVAALEATAKQG
jgi:xanthine dehydrogenase YagT iron-sulfur-binding subunit